jgi:integrase
MPVHFAKEKKRWRFDFNRIVAGRRYRLTKLLPAGWSRAQAETYDRAECARLYALASGIEKPNLTLAHAVALYLDHRVPQLRDGHNIALELAKLYDHILATPLAGVGDMARKYAAEHAASLAPGTIRNRLAYLRAAVRYAYRVHGYGDQNYAERITMPTVRNERQVFLRHAEVERLLNAIKDRKSRAVFTLAYYTGYRWIKEVLPRTRDDVRELDGNQWLFAGITKNGTPRMKVVHPDAEWALKQLPFPRHWRDYYHEFEAARKRVGMQHVRAHDLRHSLASEIISRGGTIPDVQAALHHESPVSARRYVHLYPERVRDVLLGVGSQKSTHRGRRKKAA